MIYRFDPSFSRSAAPIRRTGLTGRIGRTGAAVGCVFMVAALCTAVGLRAADAAPVDPAPPAADPPPAGEKSSASDAWFTSHQGGFKVQFPRGWFFAPGPTPVDCTAWAPNDMYKKTPFTSFSVVAQAAASTDTPAAQQATEMLKLGQESLKATLPGYNWRDGGDFNLPGGVGKFLVYSFQDNGVDLTGVIYYLLLPQRQFIGHGRCLTTRIDAARPVFDAIAQSLQVTGPMQSPWQQKGPRWTHRDWRCTLQLPAGFAPQAVGDLTIFRPAAAPPATPAAAPAAAPATPNPPVATPTARTAQLSVTHEPLPASIEWQVYLETLKRQMRDRLFEFKPGYAGPLAPTAGAESASPDLYLFEYSQQVESKTVQTGSLFWLRDREILVVTLSAPEADFATAREHLLLPAARSLTWDLRPAE